MITKPLYDLARELYVEHMRTHGYLGDDWETLDEFIKSMWFRRAKAAAQRYLRQKK